MAEDASDFHFYSRLFTELSRNLNTYVNDTASNIVAAITPVTTTLLTMYVMLWGWSMIRGVIQEPVIDGISRIVRLSLITGIALQIGYYNGFLVDTLWSSPDVLASYVAGRGETGSARYLDTLMSQMSDFSKAYYDKGFADSSYGIPNFFLLIVAGALWCAGIAATAYGAFLLALAKISLAVLLGVGPLFVLGIIFEPTKRFFDAWLGQALNYVFLVMLSAATIRLILAILSTYLGEASRVTMANPQIEQALPAIIFSVIGTLTLIQIPAMASALGGGVAISTLGAVAWTFDKAKKGLSAMRPTNLRRSFNQARSDVRIAANAAKTVAGAPMAAYRKITGGPRNRVARG